MLTGKTVSGGKLRVRVQPLPYAHLQQVADGLTHVFTTRMRELEAKLNARLAHTVERLQPAVLIVSDEHLSKAASPKQNASGQARAKAGEGQTRTYQRPPGGVKTPGQRGGKFYYTATGKLRYGEKPQPQEREATHEEVRQHFQHFRPTPFMSNSREHKDLLQAIRDLKTGGFDETDDTLLGWWEKHQKQFNKLWGLSDEDVAGDLSAIQLQDNDGRELSYEQAVHEFLMDQDWGDASEADVEEALRDVMTRYQNALRDPAVMKKAEAIAAQVDQQVYGWFTNMEATADHYDGLAASLSGDPDVAVANMTAALGAMELVFKPGKGQKAGDLTGAIAPNSGWLDEGGYLSTTGADRVASLNVGQLLAIYAGARLNEAFDPDTATYDTLHGGKGPQSKLAETVRKLIAQKLKLDPAGAVMTTVLDGVHATIERLATTFSNANTGRDTSGLARKLLDMPSDKLTKGGEGVQKLIEKAQNFEQLKADALKAREDESWSVPDTMLEGNVGGKKINPITGKPFDLFKHQKQAINWAKTVKRGLLADDAGMGKTAEVIGICESLKQDGKIKRGILFLPPSLLAQWPKEIMSFAPEMAKGGRILNLSGLSLEARKAALQSDMAKNAEYILMSTGSLAYGKSEDGEEDGGMDEGLVQALADLDGAVFIDEVHQGGFKTGSQGVAGTKDYRPGSVKHEITKRIIGERDYAFGMTATPCPNNPMDLYHLINLFHPGCVGDQAEWEEKLSGVKWDGHSWRIPHPENVQEINRRIKPFALHRLITDKVVEEDMGKQLPQLTSNAIDLEPATAKCPVTGWSQLDYLRPGGVCDALAQKRLEIINAKREKAGKPVLEGVDAETTVRMIHMGLERQAAISPELIDPRYRGPAAKLDRVVADVIAHFSGGAGQEGKPIVLFDSFPRKSFPVVKRKLAEAGIDVSGIGEIMGGKSAQERAFMQDMLNGYERVNPATKEKEFVPGKLKVLLVGTKAGGAGLNLQKAANRSMFLSEPWDPASKRQALGRVWRTGQKSHCTADNYRMIGTYDMRVENKLGTKQLMTTALLGDADVDFNQSADEHIQRLTGRELGGENMSTEQMAALLANAGNFSIDADSLGDDFDDVSEDSFDDSEFMDKKLKRSEEKKLEADPAKRAALQKKAPQLAEVVDMSAESDKWHAEAMRQTAKQRYDIAMMQAKVAETAGDKQMADKAQKAAERVKAAFPEAFGAVERKKQEVDTDDLFAKKQQAKTESVQRQAQTVNEGKEPTRGDMSLAAANYVARNKDHFSTKQRKAAQEVITQAERLGIDSDTWRPNEERLDRLAKHKGQMPKMGDVLKDLKQRWAEHNWLEANGHTKEAKAARKEIDQQHGWLPEEFDDVASQQQQEMAHKGIGVKPKKPEGFVAPTAFPAKNPFKKKEDPLAYDAMEHLLAKQPKTYDDTQAALLQHVKKTMKGTPEALNKFATQVHKYLIKNKGLTYG